MIGSAVCPSVPPFSRWRLLTLLATTRADAVLYLNSNDWISCWASVPAFSRWRLLTLLATTRSDAMLYLKSRDRISCLDQCAGFLKMAAADFSGYKKSWYCQKFILWNTNETLYKHIYTLFYTNKFVLNVVFSLNILCYNYVEI